MTLMPVLIYFNRGPQDGGRGAFMQLDASAEAPAILYVPRLPDDASLVVTWSVVPDEIHTCRYLLSEYRGNGGAVYTFDRYLLVPWKKHHG